MAAAPRLLLLLLQLGAVAAASSLLVLAPRSSPVDASAARTVDGSGVPPAVARRLRTPHRLRLLSADIPAAAPAAAGDYSDIPTAAPAAAGGFSGIPAPAPSAADDYDIPAAAPDAADYDYDYPAGVPEYLPYDYDYDDVPTVADAPPAAATAVPPSVNDDHGGVFVPLWLLVVLCVLSGIGGSVVVYLLIVGLVKCAVSLHSYVKGLYAAAKAATRVGPLDQDAVEAPGH